VLSVELIRSMSDRLVAGGLGAAQVGPLDIGAHVFAWHTPDALNRWAQRHGCAAHAIAPISGGLVSDTQSSGKRGDATGQLDSAADGVSSLNLVHAANSTLIDIQVQQVLCNKISHSFKL
jgi:hypothetical protein